MLASILLVGMCNAERGVWRGGKCHHRGLVVRFIHSRFEGACQVGLLAEVCCVGDSTHTHSPTPHETHTDPVASQACRQGSDKRRRRSLKARVFQHSGSEFESDLEMFLGGPMRRPVLPMEQHFEPGCPPLQLAHCSLQVWC